MQNWQDLYTELCDLLTAKVPALAWMDLWRNQIGFLEEEDPFPAPAVFFSFRIAGTQDAGGKAQQVKLGVTLYVYHESFAQTQRGSYNQADALAFLNLLTDVYAALHGTGGTNYSEMRRTGLDAQDAPGAGNLYRMDFECWLMDYAAGKEEEEATVEGIALVAGPVTKNGPEAEPLFVFR